MAWKVCFLAPDNSLRMKCTIVGDPPTTAVLRARKKLGLDNSWRKFSAGKVEGPTEHRGEGRGW